MPIALNTFTVIPPYQYKDHLIRFGWLNATFDVCFNFGTINDEFEVDNCTIRITNSEDPGTFKSQRCTIDYDEDEMYIHFGNIGILKVINMRVNEELPVAILHLEFVETVAAIEDTHIIWYGTKNEPFNPVYKEIFGSPPSIISID